MLVEQVGPHQLLRFDLSQVLFASPNFLIHLHCYQPKRRTKPFHMCYYKNGKIHNGYHKTAVEAAIAYARWAWPRLKLRAQLHLVRTPAQDWGHKTLLQARCERGGVWRVFEAAQASALPQRPRPGARQLAIASSGAGCRQLVWSTPPTRHANRPGAQTAPTTAKLPVQAGVSRSVDRMLA